MRPLDAADRALLVVLEDLERAAHRQIRRRRRRFRFALLVGAVALVVTLDETLGEIAATAASALVALAFLFTYDVDR